MSATVIRLRHCLTPQHRQVLTVLAGSIRSHAPDWERPYIAVLNGKAILRRDWERPLREGDVVAYVDAAAFPQGGGGGGGSDPMKMMLQIALMVVAPGLGEALGATLFESAILAGSMTGSMSIAIGSGIVSLVGGALINALLPPSRGVAPTTPQQAAALAAPSPTYSLQAQGNTARLESAIPEHFGRMLAYPDFAAQPYTEFAGNEQYLYQLLCIGRGEYDVETIRIEDTPISSFDEVSTEIVGPGQTLTLFPANVTSSPEVSGQDLPCFAATYTRSGNILTVSYANHGVSTGKTVHLAITSGGATSGDYAVVSAPDANTFTVTDPVSGGVSGSVTVSPFVGAFVANASGSSANSLGIDLIAPRGLYYANDAGGLDTVGLSVRVDARKINDAGAPVGSWTTLETRSISGATTTPQRYSVKNGVAAGRYEVRVCRTTIEQIDSRYGNDVAWAGLRAYLPDTRDFGDVTLIALRARATNNLSMQASRKINVIATRRLPVWNGSVWSDKTPSRSIAWAFAYIARAIGKTDAEIDLATLLALDATWAARGDTFDGRFDNFLSVWEALAKVMQAGRAKPFLQGGVLRMTRDEAATVPVALFSMRNIARGSLSIDYLMPTDDTADAVDVGYFDQTNWAPRRVRAKLPGSTAAQPSKMELFGVVDRDQAFREGMYQAACNRYRRKIISFGSEMEGFIPSFGDLIAIQHDMPGWGQGGEVIAYDGDRTLTLSEPVVPATTDVDYYVGLRKRDGSIDGPYLATVDPDLIHVILAAAPAITPYTGGAEERTHYVLGYGAAWRQPARVIAVRPRGLHHADIVAVNEDDNVHTAEMGQVAPSPIYSTLNTLNTVPVVAGLTIISLLDDINTMLLSWAPAPTAEHYLIEQSSDGENWTRTAEPRASNYQCKVLYGAATLVRVCAVGLTRGPWVQIGYGGVANYMWAVNAATPMWTSDAAAMWH